jgi:hypothetical protein
MKRAALILAPLLSLASPAGAVVLWTTTFSGADGTNRNLSNTAGDLSFTDTLTADDANLTFEDTTFTGTVFMHSGNMAGGDHYSPRTNVDNPAAASPHNGGWWQTEFRYTGGTQTVSLENIVLDVVWTNASGNRQAGDATVRDITLTTEYSLNGGTTWLAVSAAQTFNLTIAAPATALQQ